jgi:hypothetical protein
MPRALAKALQTDMNYFFAVCAFGSTIDGMLPHSDVLCVIIYSPQDLDQRSQDIELEEVKQRKDEKKSPELVGLDKTLSTSTTGTICPSSH